MGIALIDPGPIKEQLKKIDSLIDKKREGLQRKEKDMASEDKTPVSSKFLIAFFAFLGGEIFKFLWKKFNHKQTVPNVTSKNVSFGNIVFYSLLSSLVSTLFSFFGYKIFGKKKKK
ncbi:MAG: hypothetical protein J6S25_02000 [Aeriscardovia sp.]|nr:hypothetical protein [Aeriscardovia sp.]